MIDDTHDLERREQALAFGLGELASVEAPPSGVDIGEAIRVGRRRRRLRRRAGVAVTVVVLALVTLASTALGAGHGPGPAHRGPTRPAPMPTWQLPDRFDPHDPLTSPAQFGWLPSDFSLKGYDGTDHWPMALAAGSTPRPGQMYPPGLSLHMYPAGVDPMRVHDITFAYALHAPNVNGRPAFWLARHSWQPVSQETILRWQTADGRWAELQADEFPNAGQQELLLRVAATVRTKARSVPLPFMVTDVPAGTSTNNPTAMVEKYEPTPNWKVQMVVHVREYQFELIVEPHSLRVAEAPPTSPRPAPAVPDYPRLSSSCRTADGVDACVEVFGVAPLPTEATDLLKHVTLLGLDPAGWTTDVLR